MCFSQGSVTRTYVTPLTKNFLSPSKKNFAFGQIREVVACVMSSPVLSFRAQPRLQRSERSARGQAFHLSILQVQGFVQPSHKATTGQATSPLGCPTPTR